MKFLYGCRTSYWDVTHKVAQFCITNNEVVLPLTDSDRAKIFGDPWEGMKKNMKIIQDNGSEIIVDSDTPWSAPKSTISFDETPFSSVTPAFKYRLAIACMFKNAVFYLKEWLAYHKAVGVEHFYLCNNDSSDDFLPVLAPYLTRGEITLIHKSGTPDTITHWESTFHLPFFNQVINDTYSTVKWLACLDIDEFIVPSQHQTILEVLEQHADYVSVSAFWQCYGTSNIRKLQSHELLVENLVWKIPTNHPINRHAKVICRPQFCYFYNDPHSVRCMPGKKQMSCPVDMLRINHYNQGDESFWQFQKLPFYIRCNRDKMDQLRNNLICYEQFNSEKDTIIYKFLDKMKAVLQLNSTYAPSITVLREKNALARWYDTVSPQKYDAKQWVQAFRKQFSLPENVSSDQLLQQEMLVRFVKRKDAVLVLGADAVHHTLLLATLLENDEKLVVCNTNPEEVAALQDIKARHQCLFHIETKTAPFETPFHTLVAYGVPHLFELLKHLSKTLLQFQTIIVSNNFVDLLDYQKLSNLLLLHSFDVVYTHSGGSGPCEACFFQVYAK